jgi:hypothetical protein
MVYIRYPLTTKEWVGVLAISTKYCVQIGAEEARDNILHPKDGKLLAPGYKLREYSIEEWYDECIQGMVKLPFVDLIPGDVRGMECDLTSEILRIRIQCQQYRPQLVTYLPDPKHHSTCKNRGICTRNWQSTFSDASLLFSHISQFKTGREVFEKLKSIDVPGFHPECRKLAFNELESSGILWGEETIPKIEAESVKRILMKVKPILPRPEPRFAVVDESKK